MSGFVDLGLEPWIVESCNAMSLYTPTDVQQQTIPLVLRGSNVLASSRTGSGKTACFALPILQELATDPFGVFALIITPVRELASQIADQFTALGKPIEVSVMTTFGGRSLVGQSGLLSQRPHVVVATPGRLAELLRSDASLKQVFRRVKYLVLDEADRLLLPGFEQDLAEIISSVPPKTQRKTLLFSATVTPAVQSLLEKFGDDMVTVRVGESAVPSAALLKHQYVSIPSVAKLSYLYNLVTGKIKHQDNTTSGALMTTQDLQNLKTKQIIIFTSSIRTCQILATTLLNLFKADSVAERQENERLQKQAEAKGIKKRKHHDRGGDESHNSTSSKPEQSSPSDSASNQTVVCLHSMMENQQRRTAAIGKFKNGLARILVATDVAARGLDIPSVTAVVHFDLPRDPSEYMHRAGRTARAGRSGLSLALVGESDVNLVHAIEEYSESNSAQSFKFECFDNFNTGGGSEDSVIKTVGKISRARQEAELLLSEIGFDDRLKERKTKRHKH